MRGGRGTRRLLDDEHMLSWIRQTHESSQWTASVCTGSLLLAAAGRRPTAPPAPAPPAHRCSSRSAMARPRRRSRSGRAELAHRLLRSGAMANELWWKRGVIYEVAVPTFDDGNGDKLGDLLGVRRRLDYLEWLGVEPSMKGKGIGKRLLNRLTDIFIDHGARIMLVDTEMENVDAIQFFKNQGFGNDVPHVYMSRNLTTHPGYRKKKARSERASAVTRQARRPTRLKGPDIKMTLFEEDER